ncbi:DUF1800 domain-containing protein [Mesorhizobium opportunistum]|uniref:DUF1800 domain-containing protein n=1 Tax=Mesorhizobium opportunistum (strain LMG 24607 / HAMBI 3007 / WSM2075) TaxID=536019 RepID=F7Y7U8_MESOW|nr:DUF1800 domain-containing protein [Mesorhizobium opportunistum]AEH85267.1 Protein of unknown function DUF1800 [Mesorhizobium opportunistum WSM2075]
MVFASASIGYHRFGLGPRSRDLSLLDGDPRTVLLNELDEPDIALLTGGDLLSAAEIITQRHRQDRLPRGYLAAAIRRLTFFVPIDRRVLEAEVRARIDRALIARTGLAERLVTFWMNHFVVETSANGTVRRTAAAFEREAIRPFVLGRFEDMLVAVTRHPAMLSYFNSANSVGPNSVIGRRSGRGCNENHARELLELHTVGVEAGYSQADVSALSKVLTGWSYRGASEDDELADDYGRFYFTADAHEPGGQVVMDVDYPQTGLDQGEAVLSALAGHEATARRIAWKLVRHFINDDPAPDIAETIAAIFLESAGDLKACVRMLLLHDKAWGPAVKIKSPSEFLWSALRALDLRIDVAQVARVLSALGQPLWNPNAPNGFPDHADSWLAGNAMTDRLDFAEELAARARVDLDPLALVDAVLGMACSATTREHIAHARSRSQALTLLLMSPEFQRR